MSSVGEQDDGRPRSGGGGRSAGRRRRARRCRAGGRPGGAEARRADRGRRRRPARRTGRPAQHPQRVLRGVRGRRCRHGRHAGSRPPGWRGEQEREGVVDAGVGVDREGERHPGILEPPSDTPRRRSARDDPTHVPTISALRMHSRRRPDVGMGRRRSRKASQRFGHARSSNCRRSASNRRGSRSSPASRPTPAAATTWQAATEQETAGTAPGRAPPQTCAGPRCRAGPGGHRDQTGRRGPAGRRNPVRRPDDQVGPVRTRGRTRRPHRSRCARPAPARGAPDAVRCHVQLQHRTAPAGRPGRAPSRAFAPGRHVGLARPTVIRGPSARPARVLGSGPRLRASSERPSPVVRADRRDRRHRRRPAGGERLVGALPAGRPAVAGGADACRRRPAAGRPGRPGPGSRPDDDPPHGRHPARPAAQPHG